MPQPSVLMANYSMTGNTKAAAEDVAATLAFNQSCGGIHVAIALYAQSLADRRGILSGRPLLQKK